MFSLSEYYLKCARRFGFEEDREAVTGGIQEVVQSENG